MCSGVDRILEISNRKKFIIIDENKRDATDKCTHLNENMVDMTTVGNAKKITVTSASSAGLVESPARTMAVWIIEKTAPAIRPFPFTTSIMDKVALMQDVPDVANERTGPSFGRFTKKSINIMQKNNADMKKRNFAKDLT